MVTFTCSFKLSVSCTDQDSYSGSSQTRLSGTKNNPICANSTHNLGNLYNKDNVFSHTVSGIESLTVDHTVAHH